MARKNWKFLLGIDLILKDSEEINEEMYIKMWDKKEDCLSKYQLLFISFIFMIVFRIW